MKHKLILCLVCCLLLTRAAHAQWIVTDPVNLAGNIANTIKEIATASKTVNNTWRMCQNRGNHKLHFPFCGHLVGANSFAPTRRHSLEW